MYNELSVSKDRWNENLEFDESHKPMVSCLFVCLFFVVVVVVVLFRFVFLANLEPHTNFLADANGYNFKY